MNKTVKRWFPVFVLPTLAAFLIAFVIPFVMGVVLSFTEFRTVTDATFIGLKNYIRAFTDDRLFLNSLWFTVRFAVVAVIGINVIAFILALLFTRDLPGTNFFRTVFFMPNLIGGIVLGYIWQVIINGVLYKYGYSITSSPVYGFWGLVILMHWQLIGYMMIIYIAGLQSIPNDYIEAAYIDGATPWQTFWKVKLPNLMPSITICLFLTLTNSFKLFDQNLALTGGEPAHASEMLALNIYQTFYVRSGPQWKGIGQAKAVLFCILVIAISSLQLKLTKSKEVQQ